MLAIKLPVNRATPFSLSSLGKVDGDLESLPGIAQIGLIGNLML